MRRLIARIRARMAANTSTRGVPIYVYGGPGRCGMPGPGGVACARSPHHDDRHESAEEWQWFGNGARGGA